MLESQESLPSSLAGSSTPPKKLRKLHAEFHTGLTLSTLRVPFALDIPSDGTPAFECVCAPPDASSTSGTLATSGGLSWTVRLCLLVCVASPHARTGAGGLKLKHLMRDGIQGEWGAAWKATRGIAPLQNVDLRAERRAAAAGSGVSSEQGQGQQSQEQKGWASYFSNLLIPREREYHDGDEASSDSDSNSDFNVDEARGGDEDEETRTIRGPYDPGVDLGCGTRGWAELRTETVECAVPVRVLPGNTAFRPMEVVFDI